MKKKIPTEKYDAIIQSVEDTILSINTGETVESDEIARRVAYDQDFFGNERALSDIVKFFTDKPFNTYIKERRIMLASQKLISNRNKYDVNQVLDVAGYDNESSFSKAFKKRFNITPKAFWLSNSSHLIQKPLFWNTVNEVESDSENCIAYETKETQKAMIYGISKEQYEHLLEIQRLQTFYGFNDVLTQAIVEFAEAKRIELRVAFRYADSRELGQYFHLFSLNELIEQLALSDMPLDLDLLDKESDYDTLIVGNENEKKIIRDKYIKKYNLPLNPTSEQMRRIFLKIGYDEDDLPFCLLSEDEQIRELSELLYNENEYYLYFKCGLSCDETYNLDWHDIENGSDNSADLTRYPPEFLRAYIRNNSQIKFNTLYKRYQYFKIHFKGTGSPYVDSYFEKKYLMLIAANYYPEDALAITIANGEGVSFEVDPRITDIPLDDLRRRLLNLEFTPDERIKYDIHDFDYRLDDEYDDYPFYDEDPCIDALADLKYLEDSYVDEILNANGNELQIYPKE